MLNRSPLTRFWLCATIVAALSVSPLRAQEMELEPLDPNIGAISLALGADLVSEYWFRGIFKENQDLIFQPWAELGVSVYEGHPEEILNSVEVVVGTWNSFHGGPTGDDAPAGSGISDPTLWYESDVYGGFRFLLAEDWTFTALYSAYTSPNGAFETTQDVALSVEFDDSRYLDKFALSPRLTLYIETDGGADGFGSEGILLEAGISPSVVIVPNEKWPVTLTIPVTVGINLDDYYEVDTTPGVPGGRSDDTFGYVDIGADISVPLAIMPTDYGLWEVHAGIHVIFLGKDNEEDNGNNTSYYGLVGISMSY